MGAFRRVPQEEIEQLMYWLKSRNADLFVLDGRIPMDKLKRYIRCAEAHAKRLKRGAANLSPMRLDELYACLCDQHTSDEARMEALSEMATNGTIDGLKLLEKYHQQVTTPDWKDITYLAITHCQGIIEQGITGRELVYIATGLGGKVNKFRYSVCIAAKKGVTLVPYQQQLIEQELRFQLDKEIEIERIEFGDHTVRLLVLAPLFTKLPNEIEPIIEAINLYGGFLYKRCLVSNTREITEEDCLRCLDGLDKTTIAK